MKSALTKLLFAAALCATCGAFMPGCASAQSATPSTGLDLSKLPLTKLTHADLQSAAAYATGNGYPARAAVYTAIDTQLTACEAAIAAAAPKVPPAGTPVGAFTLFEIAAEAVATAVPATVRVNCGAITLSGL